MGLTRPPRVGDRFRYDSGDPRYTMTGTIVRIEGTIAYYDSDQRTKTELADRCFIWGFSGGDLNRFVTLIEEVAS